MGNSDRAVPTRGMDEAGKVIIAPNAFKGSLSAAKAAEAAARGVSAVFPGWEIIQIPLADGGDGTTECIVRATGGRLFRKTVTGPLGKPVEGFWGLTGDGRTAVVEVAAASGLALVPPGSGDPLRATSYGTGELITEALHSGCREIFVGLGGSATNDAGAGALQALGVKLLGGDGREIGRGAVALNELRRINLDYLLPPLREKALILGCDVDNPLYGPSGAAYVYALQKGASPGQLPLLDQCLRRFAAVVEEELGLSISGLPGGGAAGGIGAGLVGVLGAELVPGIARIMEIAGLPDRLKEGRVTLVITGEGEINDQSLHGKVPVGVSRLARRFGIPVLVLAGSVNLDPGAASGEGISAMFSIVDGPLALGEAMERAEELLESAARRAMLLLRMGSRLPRQG